MRAEQGDSTEGTDMTPVTGSVAVLAGETLWKGIYILFC